VGSNRSLPLLFPQQTTSAVQASQVSLSSHPEADFRYSTVYTQVGLYRAQLVAVKRIRKRSVDITRPMKEQLKILRDLRHDNLATFIGACVDPPNVCIITEYCSRGSLKDILENEDVKLDAMFVASLVGDLVRGMVFLHECPLRSHGDLRSSNCLVDSRWVLKVADFGLSELKVGAEPPHGGSDLEAQCQRLLWRAPELLRDPEAPVWGSQKGDVYSFGIILYEILGRQGPYGRTALLPSATIRCVGPVQQPTLFKRSLSISPENEYKRRCSCNSLTSCCIVTVTNPAYSVYFTRFPKARTRVKPSIFDNMLAMMEKYATNLEALVDERTDQLVQEKRKTEALLYEMLPRSVADQLKKGRQVTAESFESVTVYFSDIVGFTRMSAESTPFEVVDFLNDLYTCFDSIIEHHEVYKVETIGDAYMVVGGLPLRNGINHAAQVASMALHLLSEVRCFRIRHRPHDTLMLRVGIHSGPVCAGVVGRKMPRYCLFGDTVNTASRMESTGIPLKIHCSEACKVLLDKLGGYIIEDRGVVYIKGKGDMRTYWIEGEVDGRSGRPRPHYPGRSPSVRWVRSACNSLRNQASEPSVARLQEQNRQRVAPQTDHHPTTTLWRRGHSCPSLEEPGDRKTASDDCVDDYAERRIGHEEGVPAEKRPLLLLEAT
ncbi:unnamed protein product, partial [Ixodes hexagonus]